MTIFGDDDYIDAHRENVGSAATMRRGEKEMSSTT